MKTYLKLFTNDSSRFIPSEYLKPKVRLYGQKDGYYTVNIVISNWSKLGLDGQYIELILDRTPEIGEVLHICKFLSELIVIHGQK